VGRAARQHSLSGSAPSLRQAAGRVPSRCHSWRRRDGSARALPSISGLTVTCRSGPWPKERLATGLDDYPLLAKEHEIGVFRWRRPPPKDA
jgi:hypothetical protein